ncbi:hypothetical protein NE237_024306 [Protea cynaroides]|uniref:Uncharacterized protein n=1 Tax=Protea cynaroides TaxID=273540 RepID=A0A9Q0K668_9MAGN|nr:hypothetical protein NE237_024306 [Protea cynaroides]
MEEACEALAEILEDKVRWKAKRESAKVLFIARAAIPASIAAFQPSCDITFETEEGFVSILETQSIFGIGFLDTRPAKSKHRMGWWKPFLRFRFRQTKRGGVKTKFKPWSKVRIEHPSPWMLLEALVFCRVRSGPDANRNEYKEAEAGDDEALTPHKGRFRMVPRRHRRRRLRQRVSIVGVGSGGSKSRRRRRCWC